MTPLPAVANLPQLPSPADPTNRENASTVAANGAVEVVGAACDVAASGLLEGGLSLVGEVFLGLLGGLFGS